MSSGKENEFTYLRVSSGLSMEEAAKRLGYSTRTIYRWENNETLPRAAAVKALESLVHEKTGKEQEEPSFTFIDLFAGIGGMRLGFEAQGGKCVFTSEWDEYAKKTYLANFNCDHEFAGDITKTDVRDIPEHDVLLAGFPCQPFSIAGVSKKNALKMPHGFRCKTQGTLFFDVARILESHRPKAFLLENVKNLLSHDGGKTFAVIYKTLTEDLGYDVHYRVIDAKPWVPQHRERIFIVGFREKTGFSFDDLKVPVSENRPVLESVLHPENGWESVENNRKYLCEDGKVLEKYTLSDSLWKYLQDYAAKHRKKGNGFGYSVVGKNDVARTLSARYYKDGSEILVGQGNHKNPRRLTPRECSRLMGFDRPGESRFVIPVSDTRAYRQFGNAVVVPVVKAVAEIMIPWVLDERFSVPMPKQRRLEELITIG